jgi:hypothetical protein
MPQVNLNRSVLNRSVLGPKVALNRRALMLESGEAHCRPTDTPVGLQPAWPDSGIKTLLFGG